MSDKTLVFLHIHKTAGLTVCRIIKNNYPRRRCLRLLTSRRFLLGLTTRVRRYDCVMGHFGYGIHRYIPHECQYFTMLRDPVQRVISQYYYSLGVNEHRLHRAITARHLGLEEFAVSGLPGVCNHQTRMLAAIDGGYRRREPLDEIGADDLARAKTNLAQGMRVVGLTEQFDESLLLFAKAFGWSDLRYVPVNASPNKRTDIPRHVVALIGERNRYDLELYEFAKTLMRQQIANYSGDFARDLLALRQRNAAGAAGRGAGIADA